MNNNGSVLVWLAGCRRAGKAWRGRAVEGAEGLWERLSDEDDGEVWDCGRKAAEVIWGIAGVWTVLGLLGVDGGKNG